MMAALASCSGPKTDLVIDVFAEPQVVERADSLRLRVLDETDGVPRVVFDETLSNPTWPVRHVIVARGGELVSVEAYAMTDGAETSPTRARVRVPANRSSWLRLFLAESCWGRSCTATQSCEPSGCEAIPSPALLEAPRRRPSNGPDAAGASDGGIEFDANPVSDAGDDAEPLPDAADLLDGSSCESRPIVTEQALAPVDVVWIVDDSGGMNEEASLIQQYMNSFASRITAAGLDVRVVLVTAPGFITVPDPLGSDPDRFRRVEESVFSDEALQKLISTYPRWSEFLRDDSSLHLIAATNDESAISGRQFLADMLLAAGREFRLHAIASPPGSTHTIEGIGFTMPGCSGPHGSAADNGDEYWFAAAMSGGLQLDICSPDWSALTGALADQLSMPTASRCRYEVDAAEEVAPELVNVVVTQDGVLVTLPKVSRRDLCRSEDGWYYDGEASTLRIATCPATCARLASRPDIGVEVTVGCPTYVVR
ncbi:MAG: hypothetical protein H6721_28745 [Sandaracinus sp.]|nr:hypothetical protein [Sandaracinus sp.]MCB9636118.1 hypothetical protein [Sandaracinus sp.]